MPQEMLQLLSASAFDVVLEQFPFYKYLLHIRCFYDFSRNLTVPQ